MTPPSAEQRETAPSQAGDRGGLWRGPSRQKRREECFLGGGEEGRFHDRSQRCASNTGLAPPSTRSTRALVVRDGWHTNRVSSPECTTGMKNAPGGWLHMAIRRSVCKGPPNAPFFSLILSRFRCHTHPPPQGGIQGIQLSMEALCPSVSPHSSTFVSRVPVVSLSTCQQIPKKGIRERDGGNSRERRVVFFGGELLVVTGWTWGMRPGPLWIRNRVVPVEWRGPGRRRPGTRAFAGKRVRPGVMSRLRRVGPPMQPKFLEIPRVP